MTITFPVSQDLAELTGTRSFTAFATSPNDWIVVEIIMDNNQAATAAPVTCTGLTFNIENTINHASPGSHVFGTQSTSQDVAGSGSRTITITPSNSNKYRAHLTVVRGTTGVGGKAVATAAQAVSLARSGTSSAIFMAMGDWNAGAVGSPVWTPGGATVSSEQGAGTATYIFGRWDDSGASGTASTGISSPSYTTPSIGVLEMLSGGAAAPAEEGVSPYGQVGPGPGPWGAETFVQDPTGEGPAGVAQVSQTLDMQWAVLATVSQAVDLRWAVLSTVSQGTDLRWAVLSSVAQALDLRWKSYAQVSQTTDLRWASYAQVSQGSDLRWAVLATVSQATDLRWRVFNVVSQATDLRWLSYVSVAQGSDLRWLVYNSVAQSSDLRWLSYAAVSQTTDLRWVVISSSISVSQTVDLRWLVSQQVSQSTDLRWRVAVLVASPLDLRWAVRVLVTQGLSLPWAVRGVVTGTLDVRWAVYVGVAADSALVWLVRARVSRDLELLWVSEETVLPLYPDQVYYGTTETTVYLDDKAKSNDDEVTVWL